MDLVSMMQTMLSSDSIAQMSEKTGTSTDQVKSVLFSALPAMLSGVQGQAKNKDTVAGFAGALDSHAKDDTSDIAAFLSNVDIKDGEKIVSHLLGGDKAATTKAAADRAGISTKATGSILGAAAPLLMSLLGQQATQAAQAQPQAALSGGGLLASLLGGAQQQPQQQSAQQQSGIASLFGGAQQQPQQQSAQQQSGIASLFGGAQHQSAQPSGLGGLLGSLLGGAQPQQQSAQQNTQQPQQNTQQQTEDDNPLGSLMGSMLGNVDITSLLSGFLGSGM